MLRKILNIFFGEDDPMHWDQTMKGHGSCLPLRMRLVDESLAKKNKAPVFYNATPKQETKNES